MATVGLNITDVFARLNTTTLKLEEDIRARVEAGGSGEDGSLTNLELIDLQQQVNLWSMASNLQTNVLKTISDTMKATVQNVR